MAPKKGSAETDASSRQSSPEPAAGTTAKSEASGAFPLNRAAQRHDTLVSIDNRVSNTTSSTEIAQAPAVPPDVRLRLEALFGALEKWQKLQDECTTEISSILQGSPASAIVRNCLPETTIPQMRTAAWEDFHRPHAGSEAQYTIDILGEATSSTASGASAPNGFRVPERIRINSARVIYTIKNKFFATHIEDSSPITRPLVILHPFKRLVYDEQHMKALVGELEAELDKETQIKSTEDFTEFMLRFTRLQDHIKSLNLSCREEFDLYIKELRCLVDFMDERIEPSRKRLRTETDIVMFSELWFLYPEGTYILRKGDGSAQKVWRVIQRTGGRRAMTPGLSKQERPSMHKYANFVIDCYFFDYNGSKFFPVYGRFEIRPFDGRKGVASLPVLPIHIAAKEGLFEHEAMIERGNMFMQYCTKTSHLHYNGRSHHRAPNGESLPSHRQTKVDSEVIVDFKRAVAEDPSLVEDETEPSVYKISDNELSDDNLEIDNDSNWDQLLSDEICSSIRVPDDNGVLEGDRECLYIFPDRVFGYVLRTRTWASLRIGQSPDGGKALTAIQSETDSWDKLHLPNMHKELIQALVLTHFEQTSHEAECQESLHLVRGKGQGLIMLLHGAPGTGKTSTVECVAATTSRPLLKLSCGDIGSTPEQVERTFDNVFSLAEAWDCVLLLDEADILLAARSKTDPARNALVAVFLRAIEYYSGLLFLTTNRVGDFGEAFSSRIHVKLYYPKIGRDATLKIWRNNIARISRVRPDMKMDEHALIAYAERLYEDQCRQNTRWDGRQVTNAFQSAYSLAAAHFTTPSDGHPELTTAHLRQVSKIYDNSGSADLGEPSGEPTIVRRRGRSSNGLRRDSLAVSRGRSSLEGPSNSENSWSAESSASEASVLHEDHPSNANHKPLGSEPRIQAAQAELMQMFEQHLLKQREEILHKQHQLEQLLREQHQPPQNPAFSSILPPHISSSPWPPHVQQASIMQAGMPYGMQTQQPWPVPVSSVPQQGNQLPNPGTAHNMAAFSPFGHYQGQVYTNPQSMPIQAVQQHGNNVPNSGTTFPPPSDKHTVPLFQQQRGHSYGQPHSSHSANVTKAGHAKSKRPREKKPLEPHASQSGKQGKQPRAEDEGFWSLFNKSTGVLFDRETERFVPHWE